MTEFGYGVVMQWVGWVVFGVLFGWVVVADDREWRKGEDESDGVR